MIFIMDGGAIIEWSKEAVLGPWTPSDEAKLEGDVVLQRLPASRAARG